MVLLISAGVALVTTIITNYAIRDSLGTKEKIYYEYSLVDFYLPDSLLFDSIPFIKDDDWYIGKYDADELQENNDTLSNIKTHFVYYNNGKKIGMLSKRLNRYYYNTDELYVVPSESDTIAYFYKKRILYDTKQNKWLCSFSLPFKRVIYVAVPPKEYAMIPDSLLNKTQEL